MRSFLLIGFLSVLSMQATAGNALDISFSNDTGKALFTMPYSTEGYRQTQLSAGLLFNNDSDYIAEAGVRIVGEIGADAPGLSAGVGVDLLVGSVNSATAIALPLLLSVEYRSSYIPRLGLSGYLRFAPNVLAYGDIDQYNAYNLQAAYELFPETSIYLGYRRITVDLEKGGTSTADNGLHIGVRFGF